MTFPSASTKSKLGFRGVQFILATINIGLVATLVTEQKPGSNMGLWYTLCGGIITCVDVVIGVTALWISTLQGLPTIVTDIVTLFFNLTSGLLFADKLAGANCFDRSMANAEILMQIDLLAGDCPKENEYHRCLGWNEGSGFLQQRCRWATTATVLMFLGFLVLLFGMLTPMLAGKKKSRPVGSRSIEGS